MSDHHRSSYYKDSYGSSSSKRYHSPAEASRVGLSSDYYDSDGRSKRSRTESYGHGAHTSSTRYADYSASSSSSGSRYKTASSSSSSYYDLPGYKPSSSSSGSATKYLDDYKGSGSSRSTLKSNVRRIPPPLTPPSLSSKTTSSLRLQPLMKVSLSSSSSGLGSSTGKDYYGSRMRQAPPEHHYSSYSASHGSSYSKPEFKRPSSYGSSKGVSSTGYHSTSRMLVSSSSTYRSSAAASRKLIARSRIPASSGISSRTRIRSSFNISKRDEDIRRRKIVSSKRDSKGSRSDGERGVKSSSKEKKIPEENETRREKPPEDDEQADYVNVAEGQVVVEEVAGDDDDDCDQDGIDSKMDETTSSVDKTSQQKDVDQANNDQATKSNATDSKVEEKHEGNEDESKSRSDKAADGHDKAPMTRALLKLHCPYCDVRCISFREFTFHLRSSSHVRTMSSAVSDMKRKLIKIRQEMKEDQRKREKNEKVLSDTSSYCRVCELSFRTDPKEHEANEIHSKIKALIYRRCDVCDIDFRIWKVHIYHMAALEHAKRVAMKELQEGEAKGDNVKGTNLSTEELGLDLVEVRTVFYCNACIRYIPIKGQLEEAKKNHCMTLNHLKYVEEFNERERRRAEREEARERAKRRKQEQSEKENAIKTEAGKGEGEENTSNEQVNSDKDTTKNTGDLAIQIKLEPVDIATADDRNEFFEADTHDKESEETKERRTDGQQRNSNHNEAEDEDDDEIELHAGEDDVEDESEDTGGWSRRTRSTQRGEATK